MALENATEIQQLVNSNPEGSDPLSEADDHMRMIKLCLQNSLPGLTAPWDTTETIKAADPVDPRDLVTLQYLQQANALPIGWPTIWMLDALPVLPGIEYGVLEGQALDRIAYADLFALYGITYGLGDGTTTFNVPDFRGQFLRGMDDGALIDPDTLTRIDRGDGVIGDAVGTTQADTIELHHHDFFCDIAESPVGNKHVVTGAEDSTFHISFNQQFNADTFSQTGRQSTETRVKNIYFKMIARLK